MKCFIILLSQQRSKRRQRFKSNLSGVFATMWTTNKWLIAASYLLILPLQTAATVFTYGKDANCSYPVTIVVNNVTCNGNEYCQFGNTMDISGRIDLQANLPSSEMLVTTDVCFMGMKYFCKTYNTSLNVCNALGVTDYNDGTPCPNAGSFYFTSHVNIPGYSGFSFGSGKRNS